MSLSPPPLARRTAGVRSSPVRDLLALTARPGVISFAGGLPAAEFFDTNGLRAAFDEALSRPSALQYSPTEGDPALRSLVADRLTGRGLPTTADELLVTTGSQQALTLVATALLDPGATVLVEEPVYLSALQCFQLAGANVVPVPGDEHGIDPDALARIAERERPTLLYLVPTFSNPTGRTLTSDRRDAVARLAESLGFWIIEDDPYSELRYRGSDLTPIAARSESVIHLGSFSKIVSPGMRLGWLRAPKSVLASLAVLKQAADLHTSTVDQAAAAAYLATSDLDAHVAGVRSAYRERRDTMLAALPDATPPGTTWTDPDGGMFVWLRLPGDTDTATLLPTALDHDVAFVPGEPFFVHEPDRATLRISFATHDPETITEGMRRLEKALTS